MSNGRQDELDLGGDDGLRAFVDAVRCAYAQGPPPEVGPRLSAVLTTGLGALAPPVERPRADPLPRSEVAGRWRRLDGRLEARWLRVGLGAAVASLTFLGTGAAGALPGPAQSAFDETADALGIELPEPVPTDDVPPAPAADDRDAVPGDAGDELDPPATGTRPTAEEPETAPPPIGAPPRPGDTTVEGDRGAGGANRAPGAGAKGGDGQQRPDDLPAPAAPGTPGAPGRPGAGRPEQVPGEGIGRPDEEDDTIAPGAGDGAPGSAAGGGERFRPALAP